MKMLTLIATGLVLSAPASATTYTCDDAGTQIIVAADGSVTFPLETGKNFVGPMVANDLADCAPHGTGGTIYWNATGPGSWSYRIPAEALTGAASIQVQVGMDADNDWICTYDVMTCTAK